MTDMSRGPRGRKASISQPAKAKLLVKPNKNAQVMPSAPADLGPGAILRAVGRGRAIGEDRLPRGQRFVQTTPRRMDWCCFQRLVPCPRAFRDAAQRDDELVEIGLRLGLGRLDQH